jgi:hypothetical protein
VFDSMMEVYYITRSLHYLLRVIHVSLPTVYLSQIIALYSEYKLLF